MFSKGGTMYPPGHRSSKKPGLDRVNVDVVSSCTVTASQRSIKLDLFPVEIILRAAWAEEEWQEARFANAVSKRYYTDFFQEKASEDIHVVAK